MKRIEWDELFMAIARLISMRSVCLHYKVGVVFVKKDRIVSGGYNGPPRGESHCSKVGCAKLDKLGNKLPAGSGLCRGAHAEKNAVFNSASIGGISLEETTVFCTYSPCYDCAKHLANLGIKEFVYEFLYDSESETKRVQELFMRRNIELRQFVMSGDILEEITRIFLKDYSPEQVAALMGAPMLDLGFESHKGNGG